MRLKYFVEYSENWTPGIVDRNEIKKLPIAYALAGFLFGDILTKQNYLGPDKKHGILFVPEGNLPKDYTIDSDTWYEIPDFGDNEYGVRCCFGYPKDSPKPKPLDFLRPDVSTGSTGIQHPLKYWRLEGCFKFADGNVWEVPVARRFDFERSEMLFQQAKGLENLIDAFSNMSDEKNDTESRISNILTGFFAPTFNVVQKLVDNHWVPGSPPIEYREIWELALQVDRLISDKQPEQEQELLPGINSDQAKNTAIKILQIFYNIGAAEANWLEIFTENDFCSVLTRFCGYDHFDSWRQKKIADTVQTIAQKALANISTPDETENSPSG